MISLSEFPLWLTPRFLLWFVATLAQSSIIHLTALDLTPLTSLGKAPLPCLTFFESCCCVDIWRYLHLSSSCFTWTSSDGTLASCIDFVGCPNVWVSSVSSCDVIHWPFSDHCAVLFCVSVPDIVLPGPCLWKLKTSILEDEGYVLAVSNFWSGWHNMKGLYPSLAKWWEEGKSRVKALTIRHCCQRSSVPSQRELLSNLAAHLKSKVDEGFLSIFGVYQSVLGELAAFDLDAAKGAQIRARARWVEEGETSSAYFSIWKRREGLIVGSLC